jgi:hypothetical protein
MRRLARRASSCGEDGVGGLVRHDLPEPLRASQGAGSELDPVLASNEAAEGSTRRGFATTPMLASAGASHNAPSPRRIRWTLRACLGRRALAVAPFMVADASRVRGVVLGLSRRVDLPCPGPTLPLPT